MEELEMVADESNIYKKETSMTQLDTRTILSIFSWNNDLLMHFFFNSFNAIRRIFWVDN